VTGGLVKSARRIESGTIHLSPQPAPSGCCAAWRHALPRFAYWLGRSIPGGGPVGSDRGPEHPGPDGRHSDPRRNPNSSGAKAPRCSTIRIRGKSRDAPRRRRLKALGGLSTTFAKGVIELPQARSIPAVSIITDDCARCPLYPLILVLPSVLAENELP